MKRKHLFLSVLLAFFLSFPARVDAVVIDPGTALFDSDDYDQVLITDYGNTSDSALYFFDTSTGDNISGSLPGLSGALSSAGLSFPVRVTGPSECFNLGSNYCLYSYDFTPVGTYSAVETASTDACNGLSYNECLNSEDFVNEAIFSVVLTLPDPTPDIGIDTVTVHTPLIELLSDIPDRVSGIMELSYRTWDEDEDLGRSGRGLAEKPVDVYAKKVVAFPRGWEQNQPWFGRTLVASDQSREGPAVWDTTQLDDGEYELRITVRGMDGDFFQLAPRKTFIVDNSPPLFTVEATPLETTGDPVVLSIGANEVLKDKPIVSVTQEGGEPTSIDVKETQEGTYVGVYDIDSSFPGAAKVQVRGEDLAGNTSDNILTGEMFFVATDHGDTAESTTSDTTSTPENTPPPVKPKLEDPIYDTSGQSVTVRGVAPGVVEVIARLNGSEELYAVVDNNSGSFVFDDVSLDPDFEKGRNIISVYGVYADGSLSPSAVKRLVANVPPQITLLRPRGRRLVLNGDVRFEWKGEDLNGDEISYRIEISEDRGESWELIVAGVKEEEFVWDSRSVTDSSNYMIRVIASDGKINTTAQSELLSVRNDLPRVILDSQGKFYTNEESKLLTGIVRSKEDKLANLRASADGGLTWKDLLPEDGVWDSDFENFRFSVPALREGYQNIVLEGETVQGRKLQHDAEVEVFFDNESPHIVDIEEPNVITEEGGISISGIVQDKEFAVDRVEYTVDDSPPLRAALGEGVDGSGTQPFSINYNKDIAEGAHVVGVIAYDRANNPSEEKILTISIDATPPRIGSYIIRQEGELIFPTNDGVHYVSSDVPVFVAIAVGRNPSDVKLFLGQDDRILISPNSDGLWSGQFSLSDQAQKELRVVAVDAVGNSVERSLAEVSDKNLPQNVAKEVDAQDIQTNKKEGQTLWKKILSFVSSLF